MIFPVPCVDSFLSSPPAVGHQASEEDEAHLDTDCYHRHDLENSPEPVQLQLLEPREKIPTYLFIAQAGPDFMG